MSNIKATFRPPQVDLVPVRYIFFENVPAIMRENSDNLEIWQRNFKCLLLFLHTAS